MILSANQPYFAPYPGFFHKAMLSDVFVLMDCVQFPRGTTWMSRNRFKNDQGTLWLTVPVLKKGLGLQKIDRVKIYYGNNWNKKHLLSLKGFYSHAPYLNEHIAFFEKIFSEEFERLIDLNLAVIYYLMEQLDLKTKVILLSELGIDKAGDQLIIEICRKLEADRFLAQRPVTKFIDHDLFRESGIKIEQFLPPSPVYPQLWGEFIPNLSTLDLLLNCGPKAHEIMAM